MYTTTILKIGENFIAGNSLRVVLEPIYDGNVYKIFSIDYDSTLSFSYTLGYMLRNTSSHKVALYLTTENNSVSVDFREKYHDGEIDLTRISVGEESI